MQVSQLAKELNTTPEIVLAKLKSLKLKATDGTQELNNAVAIVLRSELSKDLKNITGLERLSKTVKEDSPKPAEKPKAQKEDKTPSSKKEIQEESSRIMALRTKVLIKEEKRASSESVVERKKPLKVLSLLKEEAQAPILKKAIKADISNEPFTAVKPLIKKKKRVGFKKESPKDIVPPLVKPESKDVLQDTKTPPLTVLEETSKGLSSQPILDQKKEVIFSEAGEKVTKELRELEIKVPIAVKDFAVKVQQKTSSVLKKLIQMGIFAHINQNIDEDVVKVLAGEFGYTLTKLKTQEEQLIETHHIEEEDPALLKTRAPVVTFMGHVDHGKTSLLDQIRKSRVADQEHGGITQHIGAYSVTLSKGRITFLDTPGHEAFTAMRARGAHITDLIVLVIAADEGVMPQTDEAIDHARAANVPIVVAVNKIDKKTADIDRVKKQLAERNLNPEDWGGKTVVVGVSALTGEGIEPLLEMILLEAELLELKANALKRASGIIVEAHLSKGKGAVASLIVQSGTLRLNDVIVVGPCYGKIKAMFDDMERPIKEAGPSSPVEILGLPHVPEAGERFYVVEDEKTAKEITTTRQELLKNEKLKSSQKITLEDLYSQIQAGKIKELNVILKADVQGSLEALKDSLGKIPSVEVKLKFIHTGVGDINASDVILAIASNAIIIGFHIEADQRAQKELEKQFVDVRLYRIIYDAVNDVKKALEGLLEPKKKRRFLSRIDVKQVFKLSKAGIVAGCYVTKGKVNRKANVDVIRNGELIYTGTITSLKRFKDDVREVSEGFECGVTIQGFDQYQPGDVLEAFDLETIARTL